MNRFLVLLLLFGCGQADQNKSTTSAPAPVALSSIQAKINSLKEGFAVRYETTSNEILKEEIAADYRDSLSKVLTRNPELDSMTLHVERVEALTSRNYLVSLSNNGVWYVISAIYKTDEEMKADKDYQVLKSLNEGQSVKMNLHYLGPVEVNRPGALYGTIKIPVTLSPQRK